jgi:hypothetical protein
MRFPSFNRQSFTLLKQLVLLVFELAELAA